jgi:hypothetical protein
MPTLGESAVNLALSYNGVHEEGGNNRGPEVEMFLRSMGLQPGDPWCAAFLCFCISHAAKALGVTPKFQLGSSVYKLWTRNPSLQLSAPEANSVFLINHGLSKSGQRIGHTGFVITPTDEYDLMTTMEGNTDSAGSRSGGQCMRRTRNIADFTNGYGWLRIE